MRCPVLFNGTNYRDWIPRFRWHMRCLRLWEFITGDIPCPPPPVAPVKPIIPDKATDAEKTKILDNYDASMESYASQFATYRIWLDEDARAGAVLTASMEEHLSADIVGFDHAYQMSAVWHQLDSISPPLPPSTCDSCKAQNVAWRLGALMTS